MFSRYFGGVPPLPSFGGGGFVSNDFRVKQPAVDALPPNLLAISGMADGQVRDGPVQRTPPMVGGLLGGLFGGPQGFGSPQSFNPWGSQSAGLFDQYMNRQMRMYPGGFFGFQAPAFAQPPAPAPTPSNQPAMENMLRWWQDMGYDRGGTIGGGA